MPDLELTPECRLVFRAADLRASPSEVGALAGAVREWDRVLMLAEREVATSTLWRALQRAAETSGGSAVPEAAVAYLAKSAMVSDFRMQYLSSRLQRTVAALATARVPVILLKGAAVGAMRDATFRERPMTDVDILVDRGDSTRAREIVVASGWPETTDPVLLELLKDQHHLPHFVDPQMPGIRLELHVALLPDDHSFAFDEADIWRDARPAPMPFAGARIPSPHHSLIHACIHFAWQHTLQFGSWRTFRLIGGLIASGAVDWAAFIVQARAARAASACHWTLRLAQRLSGLSIPPEAIDALAPPNPAFIANALERCFVAGIAPGELPMSPSSQLSRLLWRTALRPKWSGHQHPGRADPSRRWERALGTISTETHTARFARHLADYRTWWTFLSRTLLR